MHGASARPTAHALADAGDDRMPDRSRANPGVASRRETGARSAQVVPFGVMARACALPAAAPLRRLADCQAWLAGFERWAAVEQRCSGGTAAEISHSTPPTRAEVADPFQRSAGGLESGGRLTQGCRGRLGHGAARTAQAVHCRTWSPVAGPGCLRARKPSWSETSIALWKVFKNNRMKLYSCSDSRTLHGVLATSPTATPTHSSPPTYTRGALSDDALWLRHCVAVLSMQGPGPAAGSLVLPCLRRGLRGPQAPA